ncbi:efflux RND transporter periplasmic adaptor subunit [Pseudoduganella umbonata]|uniref:Cu(I)/Ag(I) efflux system membrane fusion protein n=1 Tax=Pseudoduganella umbonata TaxID=864828 RepID=A0A4P8HR61_9BURK|nr:efflux RND transporter periplasmic adaptor subunit [Pseudoduganella umbonata]MBB3222078.1 Cu(I)/Ag(I) efflux system membrane fusion protein [Pseudoduganella umbonata]QCP12319.1 efflux RND transporter periplasmic adaptor subunit [Pseudoduganella umbonata]
MNRKILIPLVLLLAGAALAGGGYWAGMRHGTGPAASDKDIPPPTSTERKVLYWHDPMVPGTRFDKPGKSPFMDMQLVPVYADEAGAGSGVIISPGLQQNLGIRFATVRRIALPDTLELVGTTQFDERRAEVVQTRVTGYIERLHTRAPLQRVRRGDAVATLFVPDWIAPQEEYLTLRRSGDESLTRAARDRMRALSIPDALVANAERSGKPQSRFVLTAPATGVLSELAVREGSMVAPGVTVAKISGTDKLWLLAEVPEALLGSIKTGMKVTVSPQSDPARQYTGRLSEILPGVIEATRTVQARLELDNHDGTLVPGQLMRIQLATADSPRRLVVPAEAVISSGKRSVVLVAAGDRSIEPVVVTTGRVYGDDIEISSGLAEGQKVVASGQFLIDSEANLKSILPKLGTAPAAAEPAPEKKAGPASLQGTGVVEQVSADALTLSHQPILALKWPAMTMDFTKPAPGDFPGIKAGQRVDFTFHQTEDGYVLDTVTPAAGAPQ